jgi:hypothetical protein
MMLIKVSKIRFKILIGMSTHSKNKAATVMYNEYRMIKRVKASEDLRCSVFSAIENL